MPEAMELSRLRAEVVRLKRENEIIKSSGALREGCPVKHACKRGGKPDRKRLTGLFRNKRQFRRTLYNVNNISPATSPLSYRVSSFIPV
jgi:hypothetical protein